MQFLPFAEFDWVEDVEKKPGFWDVLEDSEVGHLLEANLAYPQELHDDRKDLPFSLEHGVPPGSKQQKLLTTLLEKEKYVLHYRVLQRALQHRLILKKVYRALKFKRGLS